MPGFTSTSLLSLVVAAIQAIDPDLGKDFARPDPMNAALTPEKDKATLLERFLAKHRPSALLRIGQYLDRAEEAPVLSVLTNSPDPTVLADKWMRLERYYHSSHRTRIDTSRRHGWSCRRESRAEPASPAENLLIIGILFGLLERLGAKDCKLSIEGHELSPEEFDHADIGGSAAEFAMSWSADDAPLCFEAVNATLVDDRLADLLASDIGRSWKLGDAARALGFSARSLQRQLGRDGRSFSSVLRRARMREATRLLTVTSAALAEIGYCCGYSDQAHFQRDFRRVTNMTPRVFRDVSGSPHLIPH